MTTQELKNKVIDKVNAIEDDALLLDIINLLEGSLKSKRIYRISEEHIKAVNEGIEQIEKGDFLTNEQANKQTNEWLNK